MKKITYIILFILALSTFIFGQISEKSPLERRANDLINVINEPKDFEKVFTASFLNQISPEQLKKISKDLLGAYGKAQTVQNITKINDYNATLQILFEKGFVGSVRLNIESTGANLIGGFTITAIEKANNSLESVVDELKELSGKASISVAKLDGNKFQTIISHNADESLAIGSTFKLYILAELVKQISVGKRKWSDVVELDQRSLPSGQIQNWELGSPITLHTLASLMISVSDNTATDQLLLTVGRENVEKMLETAGNSKPQMTIPFMTTSELFKLKGVGKYKYAKEYLATDTKGRRKILANEIGKSKLEDIVFEDFLLKPTYISELEWFASANDLVRLMNWLKMNTEKDSVKKARGVLSINKGVSDDEAAKWNYIGYKGGSETGVISLTYLIQSKNNEWFVVTSSWNDEKAAVNDNKFVLLVRSAIKALHEKINSKT